MTQVIIPVKPLSLAKQRLSSVLTTEQRSGLVVSMLKDLLRTLSDVSGAEVSVVSSETCVLSLAMQSGATGIRENQVRGYNAAVAYGLSTVDASDGVAVIPADVPLASSAEVDQLIGSSQSHEPTVRLVPSNDRLGTNGLFMSANNLLAPAFGSDSFRGYQQAAQNIQIVPVVLELPTLALDIDTPEDLIALIEMECEGETTAFLHSIGMAQIKQGRGIA